MCTVIKKRSYITDRDPDKVKPRKLWKAEKITDLQWKVMPRYIQVCSSVTLKPKIIFMHLIPYTFLQLHMTKIYK